MELSAQFKQLRYTSIPADDKLRRGKKLALTIGLKAASYDHVLLSDADCYPVSDQWLKRMSSNFSGDHKIVLGYGGYERKKGLLNTIIRYETTFTAIQYLSYAIKGRPYMGVGRNLAYEKALLENGDREAVPISFRLSPISPRIPPSFAEGPFLSPEGRGSR